ASPRRGRALAVAFNYPGGPSSARPLRGLRINTRAASAARPRPRRPKRALSRSASPASGRASYLPLEEPPHGEEHEPAERQVELLPHVVLRDPQVEPEPHVGEADRLEELREEEHRSEAPRQRSNVDAEVRRLQHHDVL